MDSENDAPGAENLEGVSSSPATLLNMGIFSFLDSMLGRIQGPITSNAYRSRVSIQRLTNPINDDLNGNINQDSSPERSSDPIEPPPNEDVEAGGYKDTMFLYLSEKEKEEFSCCICYLIMKKVYQCRNEHRFCHGCIYTWSCGSGQGHDACPMCRIDGLYAFNPKLNEKIFRKCVTCEADGCNWLGCLQDYEKHEHRYYTPSEFQVLNVFRAKNSALNFLPKPPILPKISRRSRNEVSNAVHSDAFINSRFSLAGTLRPAATVDTRNQRLLRNRPQISEPTTVLSPETQNQGTSVQPERSNQSFLDQIDTMSNEEPQMTYRRLVPSNWHVAYEELRETREQLAAMLTLMTMELEERRNQVVSESQRSFSTLNNVSTLNQAHRSRSFTERGTQNLVQQQSNRRERLGQVTGERPERTVRFDNLVMDVISPSMQRTRSSLMSDLFDQIGVSVSAPRRLLVPETIRSQEITHLSLRPSRLEPLVRIPPPADLVSTSESIQEESISGVFTPYSLNNSESSESNENDSEDLSEQINLFDYNCRDDLD